MEKTKQKEYNLSPSDVDRYLKNLNEDGLRTIARELLIYDEPEHILKCIEEFKKFYTV